MKLRLPFKRLVSFELNYCKLILIQIHTYPPGLLKASTMTFYVLCEQLV